jgi:glycosyltransferase involved in cell wall biosynthesis
MPTVGCDIIVIVPVFKQPGLLIEAIESVLHQSCGAEIRTVVVDDGCPFPETRVIARSYAVATGGKVAYIRRKNGGLSAARNAGIEFALQAFPDFKYIYLLDADNRMSPLMLGRMYRQLQQENREIGWIYPDIDMFGYS